MRSRCDIVADGIADFEVLSQDGSAKRQSVDTAKAIALFAKARVPVYFASVPITRAEAALGYVGDTPLGKMYSRLPAQPPGGIARFIDAALAVIPDAVQRLVGAAA